MYYALDPLHSMSTLSMYPIVNEHQQTYIYTFSYTCTSFMYYYVCTLCRVTKYFLIAVDITFAFKYQHLFKLMHLTTML